MEIGLIDDKGLFDGNIATAIMEVERKRKWIVESLDIAVDRLLSMLENKEIEATTHIEQLAVAVDGVSKEVEKGALNEISVFSLLFLISSAMGIIRQISVLDGVDSKELCSIYLECFLPIKLFVEGCFKGSW